MTDEKQLTVRHESALDVYGSGDDIKTLAQRIRLCLPGGGKLSDSEALSLAQLSVEMPVSLQLQFLFQSYRPTQQLFVRSLLDALPTTWSQAIIKNYQTV